MPLRVVIRRLFEERKFELPSPIAFASRRTPPERVVIELVLPYEEFSAERDVGLLVGPN